MAGLCKVFTSADLGNGLYLSKISEPLSDTAHKQIKLVLRFPPVHIYHIIPVKDTRHIADACVCTLHMIV